MQALKSVPFRAQLRTGACIQQCDGPSFWWNYLHCSSQCHIVAESSLRNLPVDSENVFEDVAFPNQRDIVEDGVGRGDERCHLSTL